MNINAIWFHHTSVFRARPKNELTNEVADLAQQQSGEEKEHRPVVAALDDRGAEILRITNEIARGS